LACLPADIASASEGGGVVGWVESSQGAPVAGAVISIFGRGMRGGGLVTLTDSAGWFTLPSLPAGSYTLRALGPGHLPAPTREVTVLPNRDSLFTLSLTPIGEKPGAEPAQPTAATGDNPEVIAVSEWHWLLRHKRRSVLETRNEEPPLGATNVTPVEPRLLERANSWLPPLAGKVELVASPASLGAGSEALGADATPTGLGVLRLEGRLADGGRWSLGGLVADRESTTWRMAAEFVLEPGGGHEVQTGAGYGSHCPRPLLPSDDGSSLEVRNAGAIFVKDRWRAGERLAATVGARYTFIGFLQDRNFLDPLVAVEFLPDHQTPLRGSLEVRTLAPGGDLLTVSSATTAPAITLARMEGDLRASRSVHWDLSADRNLGATHLSARAFLDDVSDQLMNAFETTPSGRSLHIYNTGSLSTRGLGFTVGHHFGDALRGSVTYTWGQSFRAPFGDSLGPRPGLAILYRQGDFHDVVARLETFIDWSDTRVAALYRVNTLGAELDGRSSRSPLANSRFDIQVTQGLPFMQPLTRADWEVLLAVRNLFYEVSEGGTLDELAVLHPPKRVLGGISVRF
jgi:outer membrane receptor protein involved in Fe transport